MFGIDTFKNKRFWVLLIPFMIVIVVIFANFPHMSETILIVVTLVLVVLFWGSFFLWNHLAGKNEEN